MSLDERRGLLYLPVSTPSNDFYGGRRPGQNLFADSLVCLDAATGVRQWHYQLVHHGLWDYDNPAAPSLVTIDVGDPAGPIDVVVQLTKQGFAFVFDRVTGKPVWRIEERPVPPSDVPGEHAWPTQPFPTKPPALTEQGVTLDDAVDAAARDELKKYRLGPVFTPPSRQGTVQRPGIIGGANWGGAAFDPQSGLLILKTTNEANIIRLAKPDRSPSNPRADEVDADLVRSGDTAAEIDGRPLLKGPYGHVVAVDLGNGAIKWRVPFATAGAPGVIATAGRLVFVGGGDTALHALDATTGADLWKAPLARRTTATPMTYRTASGRQVIAIATGGGEDAALVAFSLGGTP
jgi:quinoprotein glucose dehydrogenase